VVVVVATADHLLKFLLAVTEAYLAEAEVAGVVWVVAVLQNHPVQVVAAVRAVL